MARSRYIITEPDKPHFLTCTVVEWLPVFTRPEAVDILLDSWRHQRRHAGLELFGWVVLENHLHYVARAPRLDKCVASFKSFTAARLIGLLEQRRAEPLLKRRIGNPSHPE
jgi:putative transposase